MPPGSATRSFISKNCDNINYGPKYCSPIIHEHYFDQGCSQDFLMGDAMERATVREGSWGHSPQEKN